MQPAEPEKPVWRQLFDASCIGLHLVISTFVGLAIGYGLDRMFDSSPYLTFIFLGMGIVSGFREMFRIAKKQENLYDRDDRKD